FVQPPDFLCRSGLLCCHLNVSAVECWPIFEDEETYPARDRFCPLTSPHCFHQSPLNFSAYPGPINARTTSVYKSHNLNKRNINVCVDVLTQPPPSQLDRNLIRALLTIHLYRSRSCRPTFEARLKRSFNARNEGRVHDLELLARPSAVAVQLLIEGM